MAHTDPRHLAPRVRVDIFFTFWACGFSALNGGSPAELMQRSPVDRGGTPPLKLGKIHWRAGRR
jgi:hypothetical protein